MPDDEFPSTKDEWLAYWVQRATDAEARLEEFASKREKQASRAQRALGIYHYLIQERAESVEVATHLYLNGGTERRVLPVSPDEALEHVALVYGYPDSPSGRASARRWLVDAKKRADPGDPARKARLPTGWNE